MRCRSAHLRNWKGGLAASSVLAMASSCIGRIGSLLHWEEGQPPALGGGAASSNMAKRNCELL